MAERPKTKGWWFANADGMPEMQEQFPAGAWQATIPNNEALVLETYPCTPKMQEHFPAGA